MKIGLYNSCNPILTIIFLTIVFTSIVSFSLTIIHDDHGYIEISFYCFLMIVLYKNVLATPILGFSFLSVHPEYSSMEGV